MKTLIKSSRVVTAVDDYTADIFAAGETMTATGNACGKQAHLILLVLVALLASLSLTAQVPDKEKVIASAERAFEKAVKTSTGTTPGCAVGVSLNGEAVFEKAFGLAEMEHNIPNTPQTIFESGSVAKQFAAAALVLLELDGKLKIDDAVRKYVPELPDYGKPITIRHILTHTAGLRDWGSVMALTGAGRGDRVITQDIALDVIVRQKALDFDPGAEHLYSNSGYLLAVIIVERVSGQKFADFTRDRLFKPLGMKNSSWRDDYRRIVPGRAQAYSREAPNAAWRLNMPIMNAHGFNGMLTTVGDLTKWNAALDAKTLGAPFVTAMETRGVLNGGQKITYALGLYVSDYDGIRQIRHNGDTAGYRTSLARYPDKKISIAVLCNGPSPGAGSIVNNVADDIFGTFADVPGKSEGLTVSEEVLKKYVGVWRDELTRMPVRLVLANVSLTLNRERLTPVGENAFTYNDGNSRVEFTADKSGRLTAGSETDENGLVYPFFREAEWTPTTAELTALVGNWHSEEAQATFRFVIEGDKAFIIQRPMTKLPLTPIYKDHFSTQGYVVWVTRDAKGNIERLHVGGSRMRDMVFERVRK